jgi:hypothetical protein
MVMLRVWALATPHMIYVYMILYHFLGSWLPLLEMLLLAAIPLVICITRRYT